VVEYRNELATRGVKVSELTYRNTRSRASSV
jgi:hypothetical protein